MNDRKLYLNKISLRNFKNDPSEYTALSVFLSARKCGEEIPNDVLERLTPLIEKLHKKKFQQLLQRQEKECVKFDNDELLLRCALEEDTIEIACTLYKEKTGEAIENGGLRKRLERLLHEKLNTYLENNISDPLVASKYFQFKGTDTSNMLELYREIMVFENT